MTTVGYGDVSPQSTAGRLLAIVVMVAGIAAFGWITALLTSHFVDVRQEKDDATLREELSGIADRLERLEDLLQRQLEERHPEPSPGEQVTSSNMEESAENHRRQDPGLPEEYRA